MTRNERSSPPPLRGRSDRGAVWERGQQLTAHRAITPKKRRFAKALRHDMTDAERCLWSALRAHRLDGLGFRRQVPIGQFIVDFVCQEHRLIIEVDGGQHAESTNDIERDRWLASKSYHLLHFWNSDVLKNRTGVLEKIIETARGITPLPSPPPQGGRGHAAASGKSP
jgi:very-short-patch-repair endonuclease